MDVDLDKWYRCKIDKKEFKNLCKKSDWQGFKHMIIYFFFFRIIWISCIYYLGDMVVFIVFLNLWKYMGL